MQYSRREKENLWANPEACLLIFSDFWFLINFTKCKGLKIVLTVFIVFWLFSKKSELCFKSLLVDS